MSRLDDARAADAVKGLGLVLREANKDKLQPAGTGHVLCPTCEGKLHYSFVRTRTRHRRQALTYVAQCETSDCLAFKGH
jgi:hypothetical protein